MTQEDYLIAWAVYIAAACGCLLVLARITGWMWRWLREPLWVLAAVIALTPTVVASEQVLYAPAIAVTAMDLLFHMGTNVWQAMSELALYSMLGLVAWLVFALVRWPIERNLRARRAERNARKARQRQRDADEADDADESDTAALRTQPRPRTRMEPRL